MPKKKKFKISKINLLQIEIHILEVFNRIKIHITRQNKVFKLMMKKIKMIYNNNNKQYNFVNQYQQTKMFLSIHRLTENVKLKKFL